MFASKVGVLLRKAQRDFTHVGYSFARKYLTRVEATTVKSATAILITTIKSFVAQALGDVFTKLHFLCNLEISPIS
jgi:hypothetical protein